MGLDLSALDDRVELKGLLGAGGMGEVHRAWDRRLERPVAVKFVRGADPRGAERLLLEARLQARVEHPHVVKVHEVGTLLARPCIVFQLVEGRTLAQVAAHLPVPARVELLRQTASGLHAAHLQGLVHRDVKPGNVLIEEPSSTAPSAFLTDFGLARAEDAGLSRTGLPPGTLDYMSPEQLVGPGPVDFRADVYSLGATLYALLAGHPPFRTSGAAGEDERQVLRRIVEEEPIALSRAAPDAARELALIAARAMEKDPAARYPSAEAFAQDLERFQRGEPILARPPDLAQRIGRWSRRNRPLARAIAVAAAAVLIALGWTLWNARRSTLAALEAARLGALAESMEAQQRMERLAPAHDLRPWKARLRAQVEELRPVAGDGPASFALGKGLELLGDVEGARAAYERAWSAGFRTPRVAEGLGTVLGLQYRRGYERARETLEPAAREERLAALRTELREPAKAYLARADTAGWRGALLQASIAMLEGDFAAARTRAGEALALDPGRYEARALLAESWLEEGRQLANDQKLDEADAALGRVDAPLEEALRWGRSDLLLARNRALIHRYRSDLAVRRGRSPDEELGRLMAALDEAAALDPDDPSLLVLRGQALVQKVQYSFLAGAADVLPLLDRAADAYRRAAQVDPADQKTLCLLGLCLYYRAFRLNETGGDGLPAAEEGLAAMQRAAGLAPKDPEVHFVSFVLRYVEATALTVAGKPSAAAWRESIRSADEALRLRTYRKNQLRPLLGQAWVFLAGQDWEEGRDPHQSLDRGLQMLEEGYRALPGQPAIAGQDAFSRAETAGILMALGEDARPHLDRGVAVLDEALALHPNLAALQALKGELLALEGQRRELAGEDPAAALAEAQRWLDRAAPAAGDDISLQQANARLPWIEARWLASRGRDPGPMIRRAEGRLAPFLQRHQDDVIVRSLLASCALERASWLQRQGQPAQAAARAGLEHVAAALDKQPRDPVLWVLRAHLEALAGERQQARKSLERAWATNSRVKASRESRRAEAEILR